MADLIAIGEPLFELNQAHDGAPFAPGYGGDTSNAMIAAARSGAATGYFTAVGADRFGRSLVELWRAEGVDASRVMVNGGAHTGIYFVTHGPEGHEFSYLRAGSAASRITEADIPADYIGAARMLHVSGISQAISSSAADAIFAAIDIARRAKVLVSYDTNLRLKLWPLTRAKAVIHEAMKSVDIALPGLDDARKLTGLDQPDAIVDFYLKLGAKIVALTLGNPKVIVFFLSIMPLVVDLDAINARTALEVAATMIVVLSSVLLTYAIAANRARKLFRSSRAMKMINRGAAGIVAGAALAIAAR